MNRTPSTIAATPVDPDPMKQSRTTGRAASMTPTNLDEWVAMLQALHAWIGKQPANITRIIAAEDACDDLLDELEHFRDDAPEAT